MPINPATPTAIPSAEQARLSSAIAGACIAGIDRVVMEEKRRQRKEVVDTQEESPHAVDAA